MTRVVYKMLGGKDIKSFSKYPELEFHKVLDNASLYVAGDKDQYVFVVSDEWELRFTEVGEYKNEEI